jgi:tRNA(Ile)-lysidine synthase
MKTPKKKILAVSGGVDSVVMLHTFRSDPEAVVAHFDHGMRESSGEDARFVQELAARYELPCEVGHGKLGARASEAEARAARYEFLQQVAEVHDGVIYTAHHADDMIETVVINLTRGTGWRGLAPFADDKIQRPMLQYGKRDILRYAAENGLRFRLDQSNSDDKYLRNRVRERLMQLPELERWWVLRYIERQWLVRERIGATARQWLDVNTEVTGNVQFGAMEQVRAEIMVAMEREIFRRVSLKVGMELIYMILWAKRRSATRPQMLRCLKAIRTLPAGKKYNLAKDYFVEIKREKVVF